MKTKIGFEITWWKKGSNDFDGQIDLTGVTAEEVCRNFNLDKNDYPGDCLRVTVKQLDWLKSKTTLSFDLNKFDYSVNIFSE